MEAKIKHLELIQGVINRMASNSFLLKGWSVTLISALFALAATDSNSFFIYLAYFPSLSFWLLDAYYLRQERLYRELYYSVSKKIETEIDFSMHVGVFSSNVKSWFCTCLSSTLLILHGITLGVITLIMFIFNYWEKLNV